MATSPGGTRYPTGGDAFDPAGDIQKEALDTDKGRFINVANTTDRASVAASYSPSASKQMESYRQDAPTGTEHEVTVDGSSWRTIFSGTDWTDYTPTVTGFNASVTPVGRYMVNGRIVIVVGKVTTGGAATGNYTVSLPVTAAINTVQATGTGPMCMGKGVVGSSTYPAIVSLNSSTTLRFQGMPTGGGSALTLWGTTGPATWGSGDTLHFEFIYEAA